MYFLYSQCYDRGNRVFCAFLVPVNQVSGPTQALRWWKQAKERTHYWWLSRKLPRNENTFERVIIPCSKFTINVELLPSLRSKKLQPKIFGAYKETIRLTFACNSSSRLAQTGLISWHINCKTATNGVRGSEVRFFMGTRMFFFFFSFVLRSWQD